MSLETTKEDLCQAVLEGIALRTAQVLDAIARLTGKVPRLSVDGGLINNSYFCQFLADLNQIDLVIPASPDITTYGTGRFALIGAGAINQPLALPEAEEPKAIISPRQDLSQLKEIFQEAVSRSQSWHRNL
jgi:glycerol kinase